MTQITQTVGQSPFHPITSFAAVADGSERITHKDGTMIDLQHALDQSRKLHETLAMAKGATAAGGDPAPILADANARLIEVANAMGHFADPIDEPNDDDAVAAVEGTRFQEAAE